MTGRQAPRTHALRDAMVDWRGDRGKQTAKNQALKAYGQRTSATVSGEREALGRRKCRILEAGRAPRPASPVYLQKRKQPAADSRKAMTERMVRLALSAGTGNVLPLAISIIRRSTPKPLKILLSDDPEVISTALQGDKVYSHRALGVEVMRVIQEIEQSTGQDNEQ